MIKSKLWFLTLVIYVLLFNLSCINPYPQFTLLSPDEKINVIFTLPDTGTPFYALEYKGKSLVKNSHLSLDFNSGKIFDKLKISKIYKDSKNQIYDMPVGKSKIVHNNYNELTISLEEKNGLKRKLEILFRAYNDGIAFRYFLPKQDGHNKFELLSENTEFNFSSNNYCWALLLESFDTNYERKFIELRLNEIVPDTLIGLPLVIEADNGPFLAISEANLKNYSGMYLQQSNGNNHSLVSILSPLHDTTLSEVCVKGELPLHTPWRVIMIGENPGDLIESNLILNLNEPCILSDHSWIKPGKVAWPWWSDRTVKNVEFKGGMNTATQKHYIDFAAEFGLEYLLIDAKWYGPHKDPEQDITTTIPEVDLPDIIAYANNKNVDIILWLNWENTRDQMEKAFPLYEQWGIKGVKVDYMNRDDQEMVNFYHDVVKKAAEHRLLVDFHGAYKPTGMSRTYPNLMTLEGVLGLEHTKWSSRVTPEHNVTLPYTRMLAGPMDYTPGAFNNVSQKQFKAQYSEPMAMGTRCHHLAMYVVYESPIQMCSDYPDAYRGEIGSEFLKIVPASWHETRVLAGEIGDFIVIARKYNDDWFVGAMTNGESRSVEIPFKFLNSGNYNATIFSDDSEAENNPKSITKTQKTITANDSFYIKMTPGGGCVMHLKPVIN